MYDLIYLETSAEYHEAQRELSERFVDAKFEDGSDFIHTHRFSVEVEAPEDDYYTFLVECGWASCSFAFNTLIYEDTPRAKRIVDSVKA